MFVILFLLWFALMGVVGLAAIAWLIKVMRDAKKYQELKRLHDTIPPGMIKNMGPYWKVSYKEGRKVKDIIVVGKTEGDVVKEFIKSHHGYDTITELVKL